MTLSASDFELLLQANRILSSKLDIGDVLNAVMELATKVVRAEAASLLLHDETTNELYFNVALGSVKESVKPIRLKVGEGIAGWVAKERAPLIVNDVTKDSRFTGKVDKSTNFVTRSILAVPLLAKGKMIGVVEAINKELKGEFNEQDREAFEVFASQAAVAIENARLFSEVVREKEKLNTVFAGMSDGILLLDKTGRVQLMNDAGSHFIGLRPAEARGKIFGPALFPGFEFSPPIQNIGEFKSKLTPVEMVRREGKDFYVSALILRIASTDSSAADGYLVIMRDTTEEKRGEKLKRNFLSLISHKLKTPLTVIVGYAPTLIEKTDNLTNFQKTAVKAIYEKGEQLSELVDKLLRFTTVESEALKPQLESRSVSDLVKEAADSLSGLLENTGAKVEIDASVASAPAVLVDKALAVDILKNLIENAVKFNDKKEKKIAIKTEKGSAFVKIHIIDNGVGIPAEEKEKIFQKFYQIENSFTGQVPGAGLGLALCKKGVEAMDGTIDVNSELGKGTDMVLTLLIAPKPVPL